MATPPKPPTQPVRSPPPPPQQPVAMTQQARTPVPPQQTGPGIPPKPTPDPTTQTQTTMNIHGISQGPHPNMAPEVDTSHLNDATRAEMEAGKKALQEYGGRTRAEMEYGKKMVERKGGDKPVTQTE
jgi:hypothetical protein